MVKTAKHLLRQIYRTGYRYQHAGITLSRIEPDQQQQQRDLFAGADAPSTRRTKALMSALDAINRRFPHGIAVSTSGFNPHWRYQPDQVSPRYTSHWHELARVKCQ